MADNKKSSWDSRTNNFDALRLLFAVAVIYGHSFILCRDGLGFEPIYRLTGGVLFSGSLAVAAFFIISGFLISKSWISGPKLLPFVRKRALRILPGYVVACALSVALICVLASSYKIGLVGVAKQILFFDGISNGSAFVHNPTPYVVNGSLWTIHYEIECYLFIALLGVVGILTSRFAAAAVLTLGAILIVVQHAFGWTGYVWPLGTYEAWPIFVTWFFAGSAFYALRESIPRSRVLAAVASCLLAVCWLSQRYDLVMIGTAIFFAYVLFFFAFLPTRRLHGIGRYGDFSYGVYLYGVPVQQVIVMLKPDIRAIPLFVTAAAVSLALGISSWHLVERRFVHRKHSDTVIPPDSAAANA